MWKLVSLFLYLGLKLLHFLQVIHLSTRHYIERREGAYNIESLSTTH